MSVQTIGTDFWDALLPGDWFRAEQDSEGVVYFESPDHTAGV